MSAGVVSITERATYQGQGLLLEHAKEMHAEAITVDIDLGTVRLSLSETLQLWDDLAPGEGFEVLAIHFDESPE